jgi:hypothetical protein
VALCTPPKLIGTGLLILIHQGLHRPAGDIVDCEPDVAGSRCRIAVSDYKRYASPRWRT